MTSLTRFLVAAALSAAGSAGATSLYQPSTFQPYTSDLRPRHIGDLITVMVYESASATTSANTSAGRNASVGWETRLPGKGYGGTLKSNNQMEGGGRTTREGRVLAQITVAVRDITEHGDLVVAGEQLLDINDERQQIRVEGRVRAQDVSDANVVLSTRIADAKISYVGQGDLASAQRPAWWQRFLILFGL